MPLASHVRWSTTSRSVSEPDDNNVCAPHRSYYCLLMHAIIFFAPPIVPTGLHACAG